MFPRKHRSTFIPAIGYAPGIADYARAQTRIWRAVSLWQSAVYIMKGPKR